MFFFCVCACVLCINWLWWLDDDMRGHSSVSCCLFWDHFSGGLTAECSTSDICAGICVNISTDLAWRTWCMLMVARLFAWIARDASLFGLGGANWTHSSKRRCHDARLQFIYIIKVTYRKHRSNLLQSFGCAWMNECASRCCLCFIIVFGKRQTYI